MEGRYGVTPLQCVLYHTCYIKFSETPPVIPEITWGGGSSLRSVKSHPSCTSSPGWAQIRGCLCVWASGLSLPTCSVGGRSVSVIPLETPGTLRLVWVLAIWSTGGEKLFCSSIQVTFRSRRSKLLEILNFILSCSGSHKGSLHLLGDSSILPLSSLRFKLDLLPPLLKNIPCLSVPMNASPHSWQGWVWSPNAPLPATSILPVQLLPLFIIFYLLTPGLESRYPFLHVSFPETPR